MTPDIDFDPGTAMAEVPLVDIEQDPSDDGCGVAQWS